MDIPHSLLLFEPSSNPFFAFLQPFLLRIPQRSFFAVCTPNATLCCPPLVLDCSLLNFRTPLKAQLTPTLHYIRPQVMSQWNISDRHKRICLFPMPRIPRLGPKARDAGVYISGALVKTKQLQRVAMGIILAESRLKLSRNKLTHPLNGSFRLF